ncbi:hypothetical protein CKAH01_11107 [Colletotrichum kahawae]|uniref:Uncharacterized protein n=1 Tax=Colletotrichum kahawae TaxID=34407 RepID=A0AAE0CWM8_COLKA|nr:hypothetical protein CKAH01_11107 [Colletotrichum kahawae]
MHNLILLARPAIRQSISPSTHDTHPDRPRRDAAAAGATPTTTLPSGIHLRLVILSLDCTALDRSHHSLPVHLQCIYLQSPRRATRPRHSSLIPTILGMHLTRCAANADAGPIQLRPYQPDYHPPRHHPPHHPPHPVPSHAAHASLPVTSFLRHISPSHLAASPS